MTMREKEVEAAIRVAMHKTGTMCMKNRIEACWQCGAKPKKTDGLGVGSSDLLLVVPPYGRACFVEVKSERGRVTDDQERFMSVVRRYMGVAGPARSIEEAFQLLDMARKLP